MGDTCGFGQTAPIALRGLRLQVGD